jgi:predicted enzyme related to lactoylglutathione lyase
MTIPGHGYFAYCKDTEGNVFGIIESDESAQ